MSEMKNTLDKVTSILILKKKIRVLEDRAIKIVQSVKHRQKKNGIKINEASVELWDNFSQLNIGVTGVTKGEKREGDTGKKNIWKNYNQTFPNLIKAVHMQVPEAQHTRSRRKMKKTISQFILCKICKSKTYDNSSTKVKRGEMKAYYFKVLML